MSSLNQRDIEAYQRRRQALETHRQANGKTMNVFAESIACDDSGAGNKNVLGAGVKFDPCAN